MTQGNNCYRLIASQNYRPGATGATAGPQQKDMLITNVYVGPGAATLDFFDGAGNRSVLSIGAGNTGIWMPLTVTATGSSLSGNIYGFSQGNIYGNQ
jgi:hypothetical protein